MLFAALIVGKTNGECVWEKNNDPSYVTVPFAFAVFFWFQLLHICVSVKEGCIVALPEQM